MHALLVGLEAQYDLEEPIVWLIDSKEYGETKWQFAES